MADQQQAAHTFVMEEKWVKMAHRTYKDIYKAA